MTDGGRPPTGTRAPARPKLPPQVHVFVRDWLSSNNVLLRSASGNVLIDTGYVKHAPLTLALVASRAGLDGHVLSLVVNTHGHSDHIGGNAALRRAYRCPIALPAAEADVIDAWDERTLLLGYAGQRADRFTVDVRLRAGTGERWGDLDWEVIAAPGHDQGAVVFYNPLHRILVSGDALWEDGFGFVMPTSVDPAAMPAARATLATLRALPVDIVIPGHGEPFTDVDGAVARALSRLDALESDPDRAVRYAVKVVFGFLLLERERIELARLPADLHRIGFFREFDERFLGLGPDDLAGWLVDALVRAGAATVGDGVVAARAAGARR